MTEKDDRIATILGIILIIAGLLSFLLAKFKIKEDYYINGLDLIFTYKLILPIIIFILHILIISVLIFNKSSDKFRYATLFAIVNLMIIIPAMGEACNRFTGMPKGGGSGGAIAAIDLIISIICATIFGAAATLTEPANRFFQFTRKIGAKIQKSYDALEERAGNRRRFPS